MYHDRQYHMHLDRLGRCCINNHGEGGGGGWGRDEIVRFAGDNEDKRDTKPHPQKSPTVNRDNNLLFDTQFQQQQQK